MHQSTWAAVTTGSIGLIFIACYLVSAGRKPYLGLVGLAFWMAAGNAALPKAPHWARWPKLGLVLLAVIFLVLAAVSAWRETRRRLRRMREASDARADALLEILKAEQAKGKKQQS
jgi:hypothetical protein